MRRFLIFSAVISALCFVVTGVVRADMLIKLKDGRVLTVPVSRDEVDSVEFSGAGGATGPVAVRAARKERAARRAEELAESTRVAAARAKRAAALAAEAVEAAARAGKAARSAANSAARAAEQAGRPIGPSVVLPGSAVPRTTSVPPKPAAVPGGAGKRAGVRRLAAVLRVGAKHRFRVPSAAARAARDGDIVEIAAETYSGDVAVWRADNLTIRGVGGRPHLKASGRSAQGKGIWVIKGKNTVVENIEFSGARVRDRNGAGIRLEGAGLTIRRSYFHHNQNGLLTGSRPGGDILIEFSQFAHNGYGDGQSHNIYVGKIQRLTVRHSYIHHARVGHNVKSRATENHLLYNRLMDETDGNSSYIVDLPDGGVAYLVGNLIQQGARTENSSIINFGARRKIAARRLYLINNTIVSERSTGIFVQNRGSGAVVAINNIFAGRGTVLRGPGILRSNLIAASPVARSGGLLDRSRGLLDRLRGKAGLRQGTGGLEGNLIADHPGFADPAKYDYRLSSGSPAIDAGIDPGHIDGKSLLPTLQYRHPASAVPRKSVGRIDIGAYEAGARRD